MELTELERCVLEAAKRSRDIQDVVRSVRASGHRELHIRSAILRMIDKGRLRLTAAMDVVAVGDGRDGE